MYGHSIMDREKHTKIDVCGIEKASKLVNDPYFISLEEFDEENFEVNCKQKFKLLAKRFIFIKPKRLLLFFFGEGFVTFI